VGSDNYRPSRSFKAWPVARTLAQLPRGNVCDTRLDQHLFRHRKRASAFLAIILPSKGQKRNPRSGALTKIKIPHPLTGVRQSEILTVVHLDFLSLTEKRRLDMKKVILAGMCAVLLFGTAAMSYAQRGDWRGDIRTAIHDSKGRIERGITEGSLTRQEARSLNRELEGILHKIDRMKDDGRISPREREIIQRDIDRLNKQISREKRDDDTRRRRGWFLCLANSYSGGVWRQVLVMVHGQQCSEEGTTVKRWRVRIHGDQQGLDEMAV
jgi:hypothetical protein